MKNKIFKFSLLLMGVLLMTSCEENDIPTVDTVNGRAIAGFSGVESQSAVFDPSQDTETTFTVGVSTTASTDRAVQVRVSDDSTLDPSFYTISTLNPVIAAGDFSTEITVTTKGGIGVPPSGSQLILELVSVEDAEILDNSTQVKNFDIAVQCPEVEMSQIPGTYTVAADDFGFIIHSDFEVIEGPGDNQYTIVNLSGHANPDAGGAMNYDVVFSVDPGTGSVTVNKQAAWHYDTFGGSPDYGVGSVEGTGLVLTCINQINLSLLHTVAAGSFGTYSLQIVKQ